MRTGLKVILIVVVFITGSIVGLLIDEATTGGKKGMGAISLIIMFAIIAACRAIWKYNPEEQKQSDIIDEQNNDNQKLDKR